MPILVRPRLIHEGNMTMWTQTQLFVLGLALCSSPVNGQELNVGDPAPALAVKEFVKGDEVAALETGKTYVVEFWATWCGPCRTSIPHLTELQKQHKDVVFIGVAVWEQNQSAVVPFVKQMGDKMDYRVALDDVPEGKKGGDGKMAQTWMQAAGQSGIPSSFIVNREGYVAWIGHPMRMDEPLEQIAKGQWDLKAAAQQHKIAMAAQRKMRELSGRLAEARKSGDSKQVLALLDQAIEEDGNLEPTLGLMKFRALAGKDGDVEQAAAYGKRLTEIVLKDNANALNQFAWGIVDPAQPKADARLVPLALQAAVRADELSRGQDAHIADTLAKAYFDVGQAEKAVEAQQRAVELAKGTPLEKDPGMQKRLEEYRQAVEKK
jgi:thiol-disulfide isomerase/thioredoxin